jgi:hypothetical protein
LFTVFVLVPEKKKEKNDKKFLSEKQKQKQKTSPDLSPQSSRLSSCFGQTVFFLHNRR